MDELRKKIEEAEIISFDIFDTLIVRTYDKPTDLFEHLEKSLRLPGFKRARIEAEASCRRQAFEDGIHEITLKQIYDGLHRSYQIQEREIELEMRSCRANPEMKSVFDAALAAGKTVCISSDMYLPKTVIEPILEKNGFTGYDCLFLSSETKRPKVTGEMYEDILSRYSSVPPEKILHIGDNFQTDFQKPMEYGIQSRCYDPPKQTYGGNLNSAYFALLERKAENRAAASILKGLIVWDTLARPEVSYWDRFAYKYAGLLVLGYCRWLKEQFDREGIKKAYFMLRDGYIIKKVFDHLYPDFETHEIYGSRRMFLMTGMKKYMDIQPYMTLMLNGVTYRKLYSRLMIDNEEFHSLYLARFPDQDRAILDPEEIDDFMHRNEELLMQIAGEERSVIGDYLEKIGILEGKCAVVDLGWRCSMLRGITNASGNRNKDIYGYYLGTHPFKNLDMRVVTFGINCGEPRDPELPLSSMNSSYVVDILELIFTAPHPSVLKLREEDGEFHPIYQTASPEEEKRLHICEQMEKGILRFVQDYTELTEGYPTEISPNDALLSMKYFETAVSPYDRDMLASVAVLPGFGDDITSFPLTKNGRGRIGIINPWPGDISGEMEAILRIERAVREAGYLAVCLDNQGRILDENQKATNDWADPQSLDFVITTSYESPKMIDAFYYHALWNPPEIPMDLDRYTEGVTDFYLMNDDYLIYDEGGMSNHLRGILMNKPRTLEGASMLTASLPLSAVLEPKLNEPLMFYCGMNWEKVVHGTNRHESLFKLLDRTRKVEFYGPETVAAWGGLHPWEGYDCYKGSIPFDGFSILKEINRCGVCLVLSSDVHRRAGAVTNRAYEACAAGAVIISDDNPFMLKHFKDAALFITYNKNDPRDTFRQIMEKYDWVVEHPDEAREMVKRAQEIFAKKFSLDVQIKNIVDNHKNRVRQIQKDMFARDDGKKVLVTFVLNSQYLPHVREYLEPVLENINRQFYRNIELLVGADNMLYEAARDYCAQNCARARVVPMEIFDAKGSKRLTDGQVIRSLQKMAEHEYFMNINAKEVWFTDHVTTLIRAMEDEQSLGAYSGSMTEDSDRSRKIFWFAAAGTHHLYRDIFGSNWFPAPGQFLFSARAHDLLPDHLFDCLDGKEHYAYANILQIRHKCPLVFSKRMSHCSVAAGYDVRNIVLSDEMQSRFIQDLVRYQVNEAYNGIKMPSAQPVAAPIQKREIAEWMMRLPIKAYVLLRYYQARMRRLAPDSKKYKTFREKSDQLQQKYFALWGV